MRLKLDFAEFNSINFFLKIHNSLKKVARKLIFSSGDSELDELSNFNKAICP